jgi:2-haloacid dehalogenase
MNFDGIKALSFDTGGTVLDWHTGFKNAFERAGKRHGIDRDWAAIANDFRRISLEKTINMGRFEAPTHNIDQSHAMTLDEICEVNGLEMFDKADRHDIAWGAVHSLDAWPDFPEILPRLRSRFMVCSHTILSFRIIIDTARHNGFNWDAVFSCEAIGKYKNIPESYQTVAGWLQIEPHEILKVACHNVDLNAARSVGMRTAFVRRPDEWGPIPAPDPEDCNPSPECDVIVENFHELAKVLEV